MRENEAAGRAIRPGQGRAVVAGLAIAAAAVALLLLVGRWLAPGPTGFDRAILMGVRRWDAHGRLLGFATDATALGSGPVLTLLVVSVAGWLLVRGAARSAILLAAGSESVGQVVDLVKVAIARPRPELVPHWIAVDNFSYPSAHSADSACVALLLALLARRAPSGVAARRYIAVVALLFVLLIGCSRVYLAVHWPSDVLAGWSFGAVWALGWWRAIGPSGARE